MKVVRVVMMRPELLKPLVFTCRSVLDVLQFYHQMAYLASMSSSCSSWKSQCCQFVQFMSKIIGSKVLPVGVVFGLFGAKWTQFRQLANFI